MHVVLTCVTSSHTLFYHNSDNCGTLKARQFFLCIIHTFEYICLQSARIAFLCAVERPFSGSFHRFIQPFIMADLLFYINISCCCRTAFIPLDQLQTYCRLSVAFSQVYKRHWQVSHHQYGSLIHGDGWVESDRTAILSFQDWKLQFCGVVEPVIMQNGCLLTSIA